jgi:hypothetical protein
MTVTRSLRAPSLKLATAIIMSIQASLNGAPPYNPASTLVDDGFDSGTQLLLSDRTVTDSSNANDDNGNDGVTTDECSLPTERQRSASSCCDSIFDCNGPDESEDNYIFDVFATDNDEDDEDARFTKRRKLSAVPCRNPSPASTIPKIQEDEIDQTQSLLVTAAAI